MEKLNRQEFINTILEGMPQSSIKVSFLTRLPLIINFLATDETDSNSHVTDDNESENVKESTPSLLQLIIEEQTKILQIEYLEKHFKNYQNKNDLNDFHFFRMESNFRGKVEETTKATTKAIEKHYRKIAKAIHPDRKGESFRSQFETFTDARDVLADESNRQKYFQEMSHVYNVLHRIPNPDDFLQKSHMEFLRKYKPDIAENLTRRCDSRNNANNERAIEGGMKDQQPKMPRVYIVNAQERTVKLCLPALKPVFDFYMYYFRGVEVTFTCEGLQKGVKIDEGKDSMEYVLERMKDEIDMKHDNLFFGEVQLPFCGYWCVTWKAILSINQYEEAYSMASMDAHVDIVDEKLRERSLRCEELEKKVVITAKKLDTAMNQLR